MPSNATERLSGIEVRNVKAKLRNGSDSEPLTGGELVEEAIGAMPLKEAADYMGISDSLLARGLKNSDHLSWQRLQRLPETVRMRIAFGMLDDCGYEVEHLVRVKKGRQIEEKEIA